MKLLAVKITLLTSLALMSGLSYAGSVISCSSKSINLDYGNASGYAQACHETPTWQRLGSSWDSEAANTNGDATDSDGVKWRIKQSDGSWSDYSNTATLEQGDTVEFQFSFTRSTTGYAHNYDQLKAWVDWDQDFKFEGRKKGELLTKVTWDKNRDSEGNIDGGGDPNRSLGWIDSTNHSLGYVKNSADTHGFFYQTITIPMDAMIGDTWMRVRVACSESIVNNGGGVLRPKGYLYQGEVEDYLLTIAKKTTITKVSEPSAIALMMAGFLLMVARARKKARVS
ncbi:hypothetical protein IC617_15675 [Neiella sp. HB171785]|uniref:GEVED domain-containing protein n=1 Tax=Neiella litorisoli TaxID=2771431 RepID=A0A8J6UQC3_9GAMM|nr:GEVED domain-containing protein [Neiella litorisoli]MBD1390872.1 hypothetical protein [Neiella litorisoli]